MARTVQSARAESGIGACRWRSSRVTWPIQLRPKKQLTPQGRRCLGVPWQPANSRITGREHHYPAISGWRIGRSDGTDLLCLYTSVPVPWSCYHVARPKASMSCTYAWLLVQVADVGFFEQTTDRSTEYSLPIKYQRGIGVPEFVLRSRCQFEWSHASQRVILHSSASYLGFVFSAPQKSVWQASSQTGLVSAYARCRFTGYGVLVRS